MTGPRVADILAQLDDAYDEFQFPDFNNGYLYPCCSRMYVFRDANDWAIVVEIVSYSDADCSLTDLYHRFGNRIAGATGFVDEDIVPVVDNVLDLLEIQEEAGALTDPTVTIRGRSRIVEGTFTKMRDLGRHLGDQDRDELLGTPDEVRRRMTADIPAFLVLDDWHHPDSGKPSDDETFSMIAAAIESGNVADYAPTLPGNTHWENWPNAGSL